MTMRAQSLTQDAQTMARGELPLDTLLTTRQVMERLNVSRATIDRHRAKGLPSVGHRKLRRYRWGDVVVYLTGLKKE